MPADLPRRRGNKGMRGVTRARVVALFDAGRTVAETVAEVAISKQAVYYHLTVAGRHSPRPTIERERRTRWAQEWNAAPDLASVAKLWGITPHAARIRSHQLRRKHGLEFKKFTKGTSVMDLLRGGKTTTDIMAMGIASPTSVKRIARQLREQRAK
jgi:hypothetical protein